METGPQLKVSSDRLAKPGIEPVSPGLHDKRFIHYTTAPPIENRDKSKITKHLLLSKGDNLQFFSFTNLINSKLISELVLSD